MFKKSIKLEFLKPMKTGNDLENENQKFPQAWYDANGIDNPFVDAKRFTLE